MADLLLIGLYAVTLVSIINISLVFNQQGPISTMRTIPITFVQLVFAVFAMLEVSEVIFLYHFSILLVVLVFFIQQTFGVKFDHNALSGWIRGNYVSQNES